MKIRRYILLVAFLSFFSCNDKKIEEIKPIIKMSVEASILPSKNVIESPKIEASIKPDFTGLDVYGENIYCEKRSNIKIKLDKPVNIAVKRDGSEVYVVNGMCGRKPYLWNVSSFLYDKYCKYQSEYIYDLNTNRYLKNKLKGNFKKDNENDIIENNPIYRINNHGSINLLYGDNSDFFYCSNDGQIATDEFDNFYFTAKRNIYKVTNNKETKVFSDLEKLEKDSLPSFYNNKAIKGILSKDNRIYLDINYNEDYFIKKGFVNSDYKPDVIIPTSTPGDVVYGPKNSLIKEIKDDKIKNITLTEDYSLKSAFTYKDYFLYVFSAFKDQPSNLYGKKTISKISFDSNVNDQIFNGSFFVGLFELIYWQEEYRNKTIFPTTNEILERESKLDNIVTNMVINSKGDIFINSLDTNQIWKLESNRINRYIFAGSKKGESGLKDGKGNESLFNYPTGMAIDEKDNIYVADTGNNAIRKITPEGEVSTFYKEKE